MSVSSAYQVPESFTSRRSDCFQQLAKEHDSRFNSHVIIGVVFHLLVNLMLTGMWVGLVIGLWNNWGVEIPKFVPTKQANCNLVKFFGKAKELGKTDNFRSVYWASNDIPTAPTHEIEISESGLYAVTSVIIFLCNKSHKYYSFVHAINTSTHDQVLDRVDLDDVIVTSTVDCYRSSLYATFELQKGDVMTVQVKTPFSIKYRNSYLSYFKIRDPLRCPRKFIDPILSTNQVKENGTLEIDGGSEYFFQQKLLRKNKKNKKNKQKQNKNKQNYKYWWTDGYLSRKICQNDKCEGYIFGGK